MIMDGWCAINQYGLVHKVSKEVLLIRWGCVNQVQ